MREGFAFLEYETDTDGEKAIEAHHQKLEYGGRMVRVEWSNGGGGRGGELKISSFFSI